jgi:hypothetical protein
LSTRVTAVIKAPGSISLIELTGIVEILLMRRHGNLSEGPEKRGTTAWGVDPRTCKTFKSKKQLPAMLTSLYDNMIWMTIKLKLICISIIISDLGT